MGIITFKKYNLMNDLDFFNKILVKASQGRYELRQNKKGKYYLYDFDEVGYGAIVRKKTEIIDIIECQFLEDFVNKKDLKRIKKIMKDI